MPNSGQRAAAGNGPSLIRPSSAGAELENVEIRLHQTVLYNPIYRADDQLFVNQHAYGFQRHMHQYFA
jgi:hypothetical protein